MTKDTFLFNDGKNVIIDFARDLRNICMDASYLFGNIEVIIASLNRALIQYDHSLSYLSKCTQKIIKILS